MFGSLTTYLLLNLPIEREGVAAMLVVIEGDWLARLETEY